TRPLRIETDGRGDVLAKLLRPELASPCQLAREPLGHVHSRTRKKEVEAVSFDHVSQPTLLAAIDRFDQEANRDRRSIFLDRKRIALEQARVELEQKEEKTVVVLARVSSVKTKKEVGEDVGL